MITPDLIFPELIAYMDPHLYHQKQVHSGVKRPNEPVSGFYSRDGKRRESARH